MASVVKTDEGTLHEVYVYQETTLDEYFDLLDPEKKYWHNVGTFLLDNYDGDMKLKSFILKNDTIWLERRADHPWWSARETETAVHVYDDRTDTWTQLHGNWGTN